LFYTRTSRYNLSDSMVAGQKFVRSTKLPHAILFSLCQTTPMYDSKTEYLPSLTFPSKQKLSTATIEMSITHSSPNKHVRYIIHKSNNSRTLRQRNLIFSNNIRDWILSINKWSLPHTYKNNSSVDMVLVNSCHNF
jgi:hypothetical protein